MTGLLNPISGFTSNLVHNKTGWDYGVPELKEERKRLKDELKAFEDQVKGFGMEVPLETIAKYEKSIEIMITQLKAIIGFKEEIEIPEEYVSKFGWKNGHVLKIDADDDKIVIEKLTGFMGM